MKKKISIFLLIAALSLVVAGCGRRDKNPATLPDENLYQAVLLSNQQLFFGKLHDVHSKTPYLTDVFYLQEQAAQATTADAKKTTTPPGLTFNVIKRGLVELYGPTDGMHMSKDSIIYWENVGATSKMALGIEARKKELATQAATPAAPVEPVAPTPAQE